jgi:WD40 repeat protein
LLKDSIETHKVDPSGKIFLRTRFDLSGNGVYACFVNANDSIFLVKMASKRCVKTIKNPLQCVLTRFTNDNKYLISVAPNGTFFFWDLNKNKCRCVKKIFQPQIRNPQDLQFSKNGQFMVVGLESSEVLLFDWFVFVFFLVI